MKSTIFMSSLMLAAAGGWLAATMFAPPATGKEPRFPQLTHGSAQRGAKAARRADHEDLERRASAGPTIR